MHEAVKHARKLQSSYLNGKTLDRTNRACRILDLGCGSGALLLATCKEGASLSSSSAESSSLIPGIAVIPVAKSGECQEKASGDGLGVTVIGVGIDLDDVSLKLAKMNSVVAAANDSRDVTQALKVKVKVKDVDATGAEYPCEWVKADFTQLHTEEVHSQLLHAVRSVDISTGNDEYHIKGGAGEEGEREGEGEGLFDVIICNPPFLSEKSTLGKFLFIIIVSLLLLVLLIHPYC